MTVIAIAVMSVAPGDVETLVQNNNLVNDAECIVYADTVVLALRTEPIFLRSERVKLENQIIDEIKERYDVREVLVSFDRDVYYKITRIDRMREKGISDNELQPDILELIETARQRDI
jgi:precorrin-4 methylase